MTKLSDYLRISEAAEYLGVSPNTLRNWENAGKIVAHRHPVNSYRLFKKEKLDPVLQQCPSPGRVFQSPQSSSVTGPPSRPRHTQL